MDLQISLTYKLIESDPALHVWQVASFAGLNRFGWVEDFPHQPQVF